MRNGRRLPNDRAGARKSLSDDEIAALVEEAAALAAAGEPGAAAERAHRAATLLESGDADRHDLFAYAATLFGVAARQQEAAEAWAAAAAEAPNLATRAQDLSAQGEASRLAGRWTDAETVHKKAVALAEEVFGIDSPEAAAAGHNLAVTYKYTGRVDDAERLYQRALDAAEARGDDSFAATVLHNLGGLAHARGAYAEGEAWARRGVEVRERAGGDPVALAADRGALAALLIGLDRLAEAKQLLEAARDAFIAHLGPDHHEVGVVEGNLAAVALAGADLDAAGSHARRALAIKEAWLGRAHPELAPTLTTLGAICRRQGDTTGAASLHRRALEVLEPAVAEDHPLLGTIRANLDACVRALKR